VPNTADDERQLCVAYLISFSDLIKSCSEDLFENAHKSNHRLRELFSSYVHRLETLRPRGHDLMLPACTGYLHKQSFIIRSLFEVFFKVFFYITSVSFLVPLFRVCAFVTFFIKILCHRAYCYCVTCIESRVESYGQY